MKRVVVSGPARRDLAGYWQYVARESGSLAVADRSQESIERCFAALGRSPEIGRPRDEIQVGLRSFPIGNHIIYYRLRGPRLHISRVIHGNRDQRAAFFERTH
jgi:toxin ParE1/3/4